MRIAISGQTYYPGNNGQAIFTIHLAEGLAKDGFDVHVLAPGTGRQYRTAVRNGVVVHELPSLPLQWLHPEVFLALSSKSLIRKIFDAYPPDILHIQDHYFLSRDAAAVARQMNVPVMGTNHFLPQNVLHYLNPLPLPRVVKVDVLWKLMLWTYNHLDLVTTPTETAAGYLRGQKIHVPVVPVSCGVDTQAFNPSQSIDRVGVRFSYGLDPAKALFLYIGRLDCEKRVDVLLRALALLSDEGRSDIQLAVGGQGAARSELEQLAKSLNLQAQVRFLGYVPAKDLPQLYQAADIFTMPSTEELQSIATLEAMASGKPVLAANARALPELVADGVNGLLFEPGNPQSAAQAMVDLINMRLRWGRMGQASRTRAAGHSLDHTIRSYAALYRRVRGPSRTGAGRPAGMRLHTAGMD